jgi:hypothetical protein
MNEPHRGYASYLLRMWQAEVNGDWVWRASLECSQTGQRWVFASLNDLMVFVQIQADDLQDSGRCSGHKGGIK